MYRYSLLSVRHSLLLISMLFLFVACVHAQAEPSSEERYNDLAEVGTGSLLINAGQGYQSFIRTNAEFDVKVSGLMSRVTLRQSFENPGQDWVEAIYVLPLPDNAAVNAMRIKIGERVIEGKIKEKQEAKRIYTQAKAQGKRAGLLQQNRPNMFTTQVANIGPGETVVVELSFLQTLQFDSGQFELRLPMTITPRYIPGNSISSDPVERDPVQGDLISENTTWDVKGWAMPTDQVPDANTITPPQSHHVEQNSHRAKLNIEVNSGFDVEAFNASYHSVDVSRLDTTYRVKTSEAEVIMNRDFVLSWRPVATQSPVAAYFSETVESKPHGLLMLVPPVDEQQVNIAARELILVIDTSGSMSGASIHQAKQALLMALDQLRPQDTFNIIEFDSNYRTLFSGSQPATDQKIRRARYFVDGLNANGGTEMYAPLQAAFSQSEALTGELNSQRIKQIVFITDGSVGNETQLFELIHQNVGNSRLYTVGIGSAPNGYFMRKAAEFGRGTYSYIGKPQEVQEKMSRLFAKIEKPVLTQVTLQVDGAQGELYPQIIPDLYMGETLLVSAQFDQAPKTISVSGELNGQPWTTQMRIKSNTDDEGIATLWARKKVAFFQDEGIRNGQPAKFKQDILQLGLDYSMVTPYTSFVAVDATPVRPLSLDLKSKNVANAMPAGSKQLAPSVGYPKTALGLKWNYLMALFLLVVAVLVWGHNEFSMEREAAYDLA